MSNLATKKHGLTIMIVISEFRVTNPDELRVKDFNHLQSFCSRFNATQNISGKEYFLGTDLSEALDEARKAVLSEDLPVELVEFQSHLQFRVCKGEIRGNRTYGPSASADSTWQSLARSSFPGAE